MSKVLEKNFRCMVGWFFSVINEMLGFNIKNECEFFDSIIIKILK